MRELSAFAGKVRQVIFICALASLAGPAQAADYYVATNGNDSTGTGSIGNPYASLAKAVGVVSGGDNIYMRGGSYAVSSQISMTKIGSSGSRYTVTNYPGEVPILNCSGESGSSEGIRITGAYWQLFGLVITNAAHNGINIRGGTNALMGSFNRVERCVVVGNRDTGLQIGSNSGTFTAVPGTNLILNCDATRNFDSPGGGNADGFTAKWAVGTGNAFVGCRAWENSDDGWDLWMNPSPVIISNCWAFRNGSNVWGSTSFAGNGNGFKLGGNFVAANHTLLRSLSYQNVNNGSGGNGVDQNNNTGNLTVDQVTSWANAAANFALNHNSGSGNQSHVVRNCISMASGTNSDAFTSNTTQLSNSWQVITSPSVNSSDFVSMDASQLVAPRQADGSLPDITLVHPVPGGRLVDKGVIISGEPYNGSAPDLGAFETVGGTPVATFTGAPTNGTAPLAVTFTDSSTGSITNWFWNFGDGNTTNFTVSTNPLHTYSAGTYTVSLTVSGSGGTNTSTRSSYIVALNPAHLTVNPGSLSFGSVTTGQTNSLNFSVINTGEVSLSGTATSGSPFLITNGGSYTVGGGQTQTVTVGFAPGSAGTFNDSVIFASTGGNSTNTVSGTGVIMPMASFTGSPTSGTEPLLVTFTDTSTGTITNRFWDFGDSATTNITTNVVVHTYSAGIYPVTLVVTGPAGVSTNTQANYITVLTALQAWQIQYFGSTNNPAAAPNADPDGDGLSNLAEFLAGTDPTNNASGLRITSVTPTLNDVVITWTYGPGKTNALQETSGAGDGSFETNGFTDIFTVTNTVGTTTNYLEVGASTNAPTRYYRVRLVP